MLVSLGNCRHPDARLARSSYGFNHPAMPTSTPFRECLFLPISQAQGMEVKEYVG